MCLPSDDQNVVIVIEHYTERLFGMSLPMTITLPEGIKWGQIFNNYTVGIELLVQNLDLMELIIELYKFTYSA